MDALDVIVRSNLLAPWRSFSALRHSAMRSSSPAKSASCSQLLAGLGLCFTLAACGRENQFVAPPPPQVVVQMTVQRTVTLYLEATGNAAAVNSVKLIARVEGYLQEIKYQDGAFVKKGMPLFVIERFVRAKSAEQQGRLMQHRARDLQSQDRQGSTHHAAPGDGLQAFLNPQAAHQC
jgi:multidrug efflux pump subunit AcrA (membrane-fusion protein)